MRFRRSVGPADRAESDRLLDAARGGHPAPPGADPLAHLLAAATAPAEPGELPGEERALAAFRAARAAPVPAPAPAARRRGRLRVGAATWLAGLAATATAGVAFAAVSLDRPGEPVPPPVPTAPGSTGGQSPASPAGSPGAGPATSPSGPATGTGSGPAPSGGPGRSAGAEALTGQCRAYLARSPEQRARALTTPSFAALVAAAGGADQVEAYCTRLVGDEGPKRSPSPRPSRSPGAADGSAPGPHTAKPGAGNGAPSPAGAGAERGPGIGR